jgi:hypothetical protein
MEELTKKQKLRVIKNSIEEYEIDPTFLCWLITANAYRLDLVSEFDYLGNFHGSIATTLIPEFLTFKPGNVELNFVWFNWDDEGRSRREKVLRNLYELIENN